jgi:hypothetical protein
MRVSPGRGPLRAAPGMLHRCLTVLAAMLLLTSMRPLWSSTIDAFRPFGPLMIVTCGAAVLLAILGAVVRTRRGMLLVDGAVLLVAIGEFVTAARVALTVGRTAVPNDVGMVMQAGARSLELGQHLYGVSHPEAYAMFSGATQIGGTTTADGLLVSDYGYPPLGAVFAAIFNVRGLPGSIVAAYLCVIAAAVAMFVLLPRPLKPAAALACLLFPRMEDYAAGGYPGLMALPFMVVAVAAWPRIGTSGRLGWRGALSAVALGLGMATHQLAWFITPFLVVGVWLVRWGELGARRAAWLTLRYVGTAALAFLAANAVFIAQDPRAWLAGILEPLTQKSVPHGQGVVGLISFYTLGSGSLSSLATAGTVMMAGLLVIFTLYLRRLAPAAVILPWLAFFFALRSQDSYYILMAPLWVLGVATWRDRKWFEQAYELRLPLPRIGGHRITRFATAAVLPVVALACVGIALVSPAPLTLAVDEVLVNPSGAIWRIDTTVTNTSDRPQTPRFGVTAGHDPIGRLWRVAAGPETLQPGQSAQYELITPRSGTTKPKPPKQLILRALTAEPMTLSSVVLDMKTRPRNVVILGDALTGPLKPGESYDATLQLRDHLGRNVNKAGVTLTLRATWLATGEPVAGPGVTVNGSAFTKGIWTVVTDKHGRAKISLLSNASQPGPITFRTVSPKSTTALPLYWK